MPRSRSVFLIAMVSVLLVAAAPAERTPRVKYDPATETKVNGTIEDVQQFECPVSGTVGYHIALRTDAGAVMVHVASTKFMKEYEIAFQKGEEIEVLGSKVKMANGEEALLAREIKRGQNTFTFRDKQGNPLW